MIGKSNGENNNLEITNGTLTDVLTSSGTIQPNTFIEQEEHKYSFNISQTASKYYTVPEIINNKYIITEQIGSSYSALYLNDIENSNYTYTSITPPSDANKIIVLPINSNYVWIGYTGSTKIFYKYQITSSGTLSNTGVTTTCDLNLDMTAKFRKAHDNIWIYAYSPYSSLNSTVQVKILQINSNSIIILDTDEFSGYYSVNNIFITNTHIFITYSNKNYGYNITVISWNSSTNLFNNIRKSFIESYSFSGVSQIFELSNGKIVIIYTNDYKKYYVYSISEATLTKLATNTFPDPTVPEGIYYNSSKNQILLMTTEGKIYWGEINFSDYSFQGYYQGYISSISAAYYQPTSDIKIIPSSTINSYVIFYNTIDASYSYYIKATNLTPGLFVKQSSTAINGLSTTTITTSGGKAYLLN